MHKNYRPLDDVATLKWSEFMTENSSCTRNLICMYRNVKCKLPLLFFAQRKKKGWHFVEVLEGSLIFVRPFFVLDNQFS